ncbi:MAG: alpha/beta fold hydrolase [Sphingobacteriales bacterium]|nr:MAG: alpha/beta fold hydrolase [Sphingobacteriales bacterium]
METLLLLHGAIGAADQLQPLADNLSKLYDVHTLSFSGHGGNAFPEHTFSIALFAQDVLGYMQQKDLKQVSIFGYSMGGYVAMYLAKHHPEKVNKIATLASKFHWDEATAAKEVKMLDADKIEAKLPAFAQTLQMRHAPNDWKAVLQRTADMLISLGAENKLKAEDYKEIAHTSLILLGDKDKMVTLEETVNVFRSLPNATMGVMPNTQHPIEQVDVDMLAYFLTRFI